VLTWAQECITINDEPTKDDEYYEYSDGNLVKHLGKGFTKWMNATLSMDPTLPLTPRDVETKESIFNIFSFTQFVM
jgi:hypothetical protein